VYCAKSFHPHESKRAFDLSEKDAASAIQLLQKRQVKMFCMSGIGETTTRKGWQDICRKSLDTHVEHTIITNLARLLSDDEVEVLARFASVQVSVDTCDPELFAKIRRGAKLETIVANIENIRAAAKRLGVRGPEFRLDMVIADKTVFGLEETVAWAIRNGVTDFYFAGLINHSEPTEGFNVQQVKNLPRSELSNALQCIERAADLARRSGCRVAVNDGLTRSLQHELAKEKEQPSATPAATSADHRWDSPGLESGWTRDCMDPWNYVFLYAHGEVRPCCCYLDSIGNVSKTRFKKILNGRPVRTIRRNLLTGNLKGMMCERCSMHPPIPAQAFRAKIKRRCLTDIARRWFGKKIADWISAM
jgi:MoaA/NifB/PqqE/SkfB family radical SAM enzyme